MNLNIFFWEGFRRFPQNPKRVQGKKDFKNPFISLLNSSTLQIPELRIWRGLFEWRRGRGRRNLETIRATVIKGSDAVRGVVYGLEGTESKFPPNWIHWTEKETHLDSPPEQVQLLGCHWRRNSSISTLSHQPINNNEQTKQRGRTIVQPTVISTLGINNRETLWIWFSNGQSRGVNAVS